MNVIKNIVHSEHSVDRAGWGFEHIVTPRPSCLETKRARIKLRQLTTLKPDVINGYVVRLVATGRSAFYAIGEFKYTFDEALDVLEGRASLPVPVQMGLELEIAS